MDNFKDLYVNQMLTNNSINIPVYTDNPITIKGVRINNAWPGIYVDNENGDDNNDGLTPDTAVRTYEMALWKAGAFDRCTIYLKYGQTYDFNKPFPNGLNSICISDRTIVVLPYGNSSLDKPVINYYRHTYSSTNGNTYYTVTNYVDLTNSRMRYNNIKFYLQPRDDTNIPDSSSVLIFIVVNSLLTLRFCEVVSPDSWNTIGRSRDFGFGSVMMDRSTVDGKVSVIDVNMSTGTVANFASTLKNGATWAINYVKDSNGVPRSILSNVVL